MEWRYHKGWDYGGFIRWWNMLENGKVPLKDNWNTHTIILFLKFHFLFEACELMFKCWRRKPRWETFIRIKEKITKINKWKHSEQCKCCLRLDFLTVNRGWQQIFWHYKGNPKTIQKMSSIYPDTTYQHIIMEHCKWNSIPLPIRVTHP